PVTPRPCRSRAPVFNRSVSDLGPHQSPIRIKAWENSKREFLPGPWQSLCPRKLSVPRRVQGNRITDPLAHPFERPTQVWLTAWAYHLIKSFPSCLVFRDGTAANQISWFLTNPYTSSLPHPSLQRSLSGKRLGDIEGHPVFHDA